MLGQPELNEIDCRAFVQKHGCVCLSGTYRRAPEHPFPQAIHDCFDVLQWAGADAAKLGADPSQGFLLG